jgi:membrane fusion protein, multidrug efflux system
MKRPLMAALLMLSGLAAGCGKSEAAKTTPPPPSVYVAEAVQRDEPVVHEWIGTAEGDVNAEIRPKLEGYLLRRSYVEGRTVRQGDVLFEIDPRQFRAQLQQAEANLAQAAAAVAKADRDVARFEPLAAQKAISQQELDNARSSQEAARASYGALRAAVEQTRLMLGWTRVTSPISGVAGIANAQVGNLVSPQTVLTTVSDVDPIRVEFPMSEREYLRYQNDASMRNAPLDLVLADGSVFPHKGRIAMSGRDVNIGTGTIAVIGLFPNPGNVIRPGQYAKVRAVMEVRRGAVLIPQRAVNELQGIYQVAVVGAGNKAEVRMVKPGARVGTDWMIDEGIRAGESVVIEGFSRVKDGQAVTPLPAPATAEGAK